MVSICILNWNCLDTLKRTIRRIRLEMTFPYEIIVYDQSSTDGSREFLESQSIPNLRHVLSRENIGNSRSRNEMVKAAKYKYVLLLDSDIVPIPNSIRSMVEYMEATSNLAFLGYDFKSYSNKWVDVTRFEKEITPKDVKIIGVDYKYKIALTQYGLFRKDILMECPFPEFYPFDREGWGGEDDMVGQAIAENPAQFGYGAIIDGRTYFHNKSSSIKQMGEDTFRSTYMKRYSYCKYFENFLTAEQKIDALKKQRLPDTKLKCNHYHWEGHENLGDTATKYLLEKDFPFFKFDAKEKKKLLMFGGSIFNHLYGANKKLGGDFKKVLMFGVGASKQSEIDEGIDQFKKKKSSFRIVPRGPRTAAALKSRGIECEKPCGDVIQLFSSREAIKGKLELPIKILTPYAHNSFLAERSILARVANDKKSFQSLPFLNMGAFFQMMKNYGEVQSPQVHPFLIAAMVGKPCKLYASDWRVEDFKYFSSFKAELSAEEAYAFRAEAQQNVKKFINSFYSNLKFIHE